jgi:hypothetical protein
MTAPQSISQRVVRFIDRNRLAALVVWTALIVGAYVALREPSPDFYTSERKACEAKCAPLPGRLETLRQERAFQNSPRPAYKYPECKCG